MLRFIIFILFFFFLHVIQGSRSIVFFSYEMKSNKYLSINIIYLFKIISNILPLIYYIHIYYYKIKTLLSKSTTRNHQTKIKNYINMGIFPEPNVERGRTLSRISVAKGSTLNFRGRKSNSLMNLCGKSFCHHYFFFIPTSPPLYSFSSFYIL